MDREGFRNRLKQYKEAKGFDPQLKYWEWKQKYDSAPQPDSMPGKVQSDQPTPVSQQSEDRAHRWDNGYVDTNREPFDSPYDDARYHDYRKPRFELRKGDVHYSNPNLLKWMGRFGKVLRGGSLLGETIQNLFPSEEAELIEDLRVKMDKQNKWLTGQEDVPKYDEGGEVIGPPTYEDWYKDITKPTLNGFDDIHLKVGMEEAATDLHNMAMMLPGYAERWAEYQRSKPKEDPSIDQFVDDLWENENPNNTGYRNGKYYPHKSPEGGTMTIGPGFKIGSGSHRITKKQAERGMTKARLNQEARYIGKQHLNAVDQFINYGQTTNPADTVSPQIKMGLMDLRHQVGPLNTWHGLRDAVLSGDLDKIKKESTVTWSNNGDIKVDKRRKKIRDEKYFYYE